MLSIAKFFLNYVSVSDNFEKATIPFLWCSRAFDLSYIFSTPENEKILGWATVTNLCAP